MERQEILAMSDTELLVALDGLRGLLARSWARGAPGQLYWAFDLALVSSECVMRGLRWGPLPHPDQFSIWEGRP
jgi:hypothetical protein